ncbi:MAG: hypothetical protein GMKNLPBB_00286 [Myxococcota bacterium]|nr:hypothetical protein [Myxococcota bacterium]
MPRKPEDIRSILATDCGSTTTKAILIEYDEANREYRLTGRGEAPTTVEAPFEDVTRGVLNAIQEISELRGRPFIAGGAILRPQQGEAGADIYISTSSAGGGLQMVVAGVVKSMTAESAQRAALGAGSIVMDIIASNDRRKPHEKIERIRQLRPDMILLAGGTDGGTIKHVVQLAELISAANPRPRLGQGYDLPIIYSGNKEARELIREILGRKCALHITGNVRPVLEMEDLAPSRDKIHDLFMEHVMAQAPGYRKLMDWADAPIMPTPGAVGLLIEMEARKKGVNVLGVDIGGATTDVFSVFDGVFNRTVSANLGMSYSVCNVLAEAGVENIMRWTPIEISPEDLRNRIANKMIRPTTIPQGLEELKIEQAIAREALRLSLVQHKEFAVSLKGVQTERDISQAFEQSGGGQTLVNMMKLDMIIGSGGVLSHAPRRSQSMKIMIDSFLPEGFTELTVDSIFMMPHLGVLSTIHETAALQVFEKDCLIRLGACIAPVESKRMREGDVMAHVRLEIPSSQGKPWSGPIRYGEIILVPATYGEPIRAVAEPARGVDLGAGRDQPVEKMIHGGVVGIALDGRGRRPFLDLRQASDRVARLARWSRDFDEYPEG